MNSALPPQGTRDRWRTVRRALWVLSTLALLGLIVVGYRRFVLLHPEPTIAFEVEGLSLELLNPKILGVLAVLPWFVAVLPTSLADLPWPQRALSLVTRLAFACALAFGMARLARTITTEKVCTVYVVDVSNSISDEAIADAEGMLREAASGKPNDAEMRVVSFARRARVVDRDPEGGYRLTRHGEGRSGELAQEGAGSNLAEAMQLAYGLYPPGYLKRAVLISDGVETEGDALAESNRARGFGIRVYTVPYERPSPPEVALRSLDLPPRVKVGETFDVKAVIYASRATKARGKLYQGEAFNGLDGVRELSLEPGLNTIAWKSVVRIGGPLTYALVLDEIEKDTFPDNNRVATTIDVPGRPLVLYIEGTPEQAGPLSSALTAQQFDVDVRAPIGFPGSIDELSRYDFLIVSDVEKARLDASSQDLIERYLRDLGGGFLFAGGEGGFGLGGWYRTPMERLLPVKMENDAKKEMPGVAMTLVLDRSGSMAGLPIEMAKAAAKATVETLSPDDLIEVIAFDNQPARYVKSQPARNLTRISADIARIQPGGGTEIFSALDAALQDLTVTQARRKHVILLTDGRAPTEGVRELVGAMAAESITVSTVGLGGDLDEGLLRMIAETGGGRFHAVPDANNLPKIFTKETELIARAAAVEEWFPVVQTGQAQFLKGLDVRSSPYLHGYVSTQMKPAPAEQILASETGEPILARWHVGLGWSLAWTSDVKARWSVEWIRWPGFEQFWGQLVREHMRQKHTRELDMKAEIVDGRLQASVDAFTLDERFENGLAPRLSITGPEPKGATTSAPFRQTAPGRYEVDYPLPQYGSFLLKAEHFREQPDGTKKLSAVSYGHVSNPYPREYASFEPNRALLSRVAQAGGGTFSPSVADVFSSNGESLTAHEDLWSNFIYVALGLFIFDLLLRRVRFFDRKFVAKRS